MKTGDKFIKFTGKKHNGDDKFSSATTLFNTRYRIKNISLYEAEYIYNEDAYSSVAQHGTLYELEIETLLSIKHFTYPTKAERDADYHRFLKTFNFEVQESDEKCKP